MRIEEIFGDLPVLETERLRLRKVTMEDAESMYEYGRDEEVARYVTWEAHQSLSDTKNFIEYILGQYEKGDLAPWGIEEKESGKLIGTIDFVSWQSSHQTAEIGYVLSRDCWGKGLMTEAAEAVLAFGFGNMDLVRIQAKCFTENTGSARVMEKIGMTLEGVMRKAMYMKGKHWDLKLYAILREEYAGGNRPNR